MGPGQEGPADLDLRLFRAIVVIAGKPDGLAGLAVDRDQRAPRFHRFAEDDPEALLAPALAVGVLFPSERITGQGVDRIPVVGPEWPHLQELSAERGLQLKHSHCSTYFG